MARALGRMRSIWLPTPRVLGTAIVVMAFCNRANATPVYEVAATVDNTGGGALTDHQVSFSLNTANLIAAGKLQALGGDLRVTDASGASLCHFLQGPLNDPSTIVWVKVPAVSAGGTRPLLVYYGDPSALSTDGLANEMQSLRSTTKVRSH